MLCQFLTSWCIQAECHRSRASAFAYMRQKNLADRLAGGPLYQLVQYPARFYTRRKSDLGIQPVNFSDSSIEF